MKNIKNIAFDLGGVVLALSLEGAIRTFEKMGLVDARERLDAFVQKGVFADLESGRIMPGTAMWTTYRSGTSICCCACDRRVIRCACCQIPIPL